MSESLLRRTERDGDRVRSLGAARRQEISFAITWCLRKLWGSQSWLQPAFSRRPLGTAASRRSREPPERRLRAGLPAPQCACGPVRPIKGSGRPIDNRPQVENLPHKSGRDTNAQPYKFWGYQGRSLRRPTVWIAMRAWGVDITDFQTDPLRIFSAIRSMIPWSIPKV